MTTTNPIKQPILLVSAAFILFGVGLFSILSHTLFQDEQPSKLAQAAKVAEDSCKTVHGQALKLTITDHGITPNMLSAQRCDSVTVVNNTGHEVIAALGPHEHHIDYPGFKEKLLSLGQSYTFRLYQAGTFPLHDHDDEALRATIVVK